MKTIDTLKAMIELVKGEPSKEHAREMDKIRSLREQRKESRGYRADNEESQGA